MEPVGALFFTVIFGITGGCILKGTIDEKRSELKRMKVYAITPKRDGTRVITHGMLHEGWSEITTIH